MSQPNPILQFKANPTSRVAAIKAMCAQCFGCTETHLEKDFRQSIRECTSTNCALYELRPFTSGKTALKATNPSDNNNSMPIHHVECIQVKKTSKVAKI